MIVVSLVLGLYLAPLSYGFTALFTTTAVVRLYALLHELSRHLLLRRLEETALGAAIGALVALLVLRTDTRDTVRAARGRYFDAVADVLRALAEPGRDGALPPGTPELQARLRVLDLRTHQLALVVTRLTTPLGHSVIRGNDPRRGRYRMALQTGLSLRIRTVARRRGVRHGPVPAGLVRAIGILADAAEALGATSPRSARPTDEVTRLLADAQDVLWSESV
ncbi:hypothetical protein ACWGJV_38175 [Streptomyces tendae]